MFDFSASVSGFGTPNLGAPKLLKGTFLRTPLKGSILWILLGESRNPSKPTV